eukprot:197929_1
MHLYARLTPCKTVCLCSHAVRSFRVVFLVVACLLTMTRGCVMLIGMDSPDGWRLLAVYFVVFLLPVFWEYFLFSLLILLSIECLFNIHQTRGFLSRNLLAIYITQLLMFFSVCVASSCWLASISTHYADETPPKVQSVWDTNSVLYSAFVSLILFVCGTIFTLKSYRVLKPLFQSLPIFNSWKLQRYLTMIMLFCFIFLLRFVWNTLYFFKLNPLKHQIDAWVRTDRPKYFTTLLVYFGVSELIPVTFMIFAFRNFLSRDLQNQRKETARSKILSARANVIHTPKRSMSTGIIALHNNHPSSLDINIPSVMQPLLSLTPTPTMQLATPPSPPHFICANVAASTGVGRYTVAGGRHSGASYTGRNYSLRGI